MSDDNQNPDNNINNLPEDKNLFDDLGLSVEFGEVQVGQVYPIYGIITNIMSEEPGNVVITINDNITATLNVVEQEKIDALKNRTFDPGIFLCMITAVNSSSILADCSTVIFGKNNNVVQ